MVPNYLIQDMLEVMQLGWVASAAIVLITLCLFYLVRDIQRVFARRRARKVRKEHHHQKEQIEEAIEKIMDLYHAGSCDEEECLPPQDVQDRSNAIQEIYQIAHDPSRWTGDLIPE